MPTLLRERDDLRRETEALHSKLDALTHARATLEDELRQLKERHSVLLQKAVDEAELKEEALRQKVSFPSRLSKGALPDEPRTGFRPAHLPKGLGIPFGPPIIMPS